MLPLFPCLLYLFFLLSSTRQRPHLLPPAPFILLLLLLPILSDLQKENNPTASSCSFFAELNKGNNHFAAIIIFPFLSSLLLNDTSTPAASSVSFFSDWTQEHHQPSSFCLLPAARRDQENINSHHLLPPISWLLNRQPSLPSLVIRCCCQRETRKGDFSIFTLLTFPSFLLLFPPAGLDPRPEEATRLLSSSFSDPPQAQTRRNSDQHPSSPSSVCFFSDWTQAKHCSHHHHLLSSPWISETSKQETPSTSSSPFSV